MDKVFLSIYDFFETRRKLLLAVFAACFVVMGYLALQVKFEEDIAKILPKDRKIEKMNQVFQNAKFMDKLVVMVSLKDSTAIAQPDSLVAYADDLVRQVQTSLPQFISKINDRVDDDIALQLFDAINKNLPIYLTEKDYTTIDSLIAPATIKATLVNNYKTLTSPAGIALKSMISNDPVGISFIGLRKLQQLQYDENFELYDSYVMTKDQRTLMLFITPKYPPNNTVQNVHLLAGIDAITDSLYKGGSSIVTASYFGATAVALGNSLQLRNDALLTQGATVLFIIIFLGLYFKKKRAPFIILIPVVFGALFSLMCIYFIKGSISVIALGTGSVVLGIAVNYSLHVFNHYRHTKSMKEVIGDLAQPLTIGSFTSIGGFLCLQFVESEMLQDLGLFAACSLVGASLCSLIFLPHLIDSKKEQTGHTFSENSWIDRIASLNPEYNRYIVMGILLLTIVFGYNAGKVGFETDLNSMNFMNVKTRKAEAQLNKINAYAMQSVYLVTEGNTLDEALVNNEKVIGDIEALKEKNIVKKYSGVSSVIISNSLQKQRIQRWNTYWTNDKKQQLLAILQKEGVAAGFKITAFESFKNLLNTTYQIADTASMAGIRKNFVDDFIAEKPGNTTVVTLMKVAPANKTAVYKAFENNTAVTVLDKQYLTSKMVDIINADFTKIALMSSILVFSVLLLTFGRIELTLVSFIPMFIAWVWILGIMGLLGIQFNIVNIIISALIFGLGDDYSLFIMDGLLREYKTGRKNLSAYKSSIFLSAITTIAGLGVLIFAQHPALRSIALISIIGIVCVVLMSQILIPFLFAILIKKRVQKKHFPWTLSGFVLTIFAFAYFVFGCIMLLIFGLLFKVIPFNRLKLKFLYTTIISVFAKSMVYIMMNVKKVIINPLQENHRQPAIIISNHQSFLDILSLVMLHPKLILFTNNWVWNSPVFGAVVRMADYYPVSEGAENSIELLKEKVKQGYSIVIFPEGTRAADGVIKRFHKGAFYLAEQLKLDLLPIVIHGTGYTMTKGDFLLKNGTITLKYLPRIQATDISFGLGHAERTKKISRYFKDEFNKLSEAVEQPTYYRERLRYNYLYKGPVLEWYMKIKVKLENNYQLFHELVPKQGKILDIGCGYGFMPYMLHFTSPQRNITGIDYDEEKIATANHCFDKNAMVNFSFADAMQFQFEQYDCIIMADMLHYLQPIQQEQLIKKCMQHLTDNGVIIIRDGNCDLKERQKGTWLTEFFSTKIIGFNKTAGKGLSFLSGKFVKEIVESKGMSCEEIDNTTFTSNVIFVIKKKIQRHGE